MDLTQLRDLSIVIFTVLGIIASLVIIVATIVIFTKVMALINSLQTIVANIRDTSTLVADIIVRPATKVGGFLGFFRRSKRRKGDK